jgi:hypothetical protein
MDYGMRPTTAAVDGRGRFGGQRGAGRNLQPTAIRERTERVQMLAPNENADPDDDDNTTMGEVDWVIDYQEAFKQTGSHIKARELVRASSRQQRERNVVTRDQDRRTRVQQAQNARAKIRSKTDGPHAGLNVIEREKTRTKEPAPGQDPLDFELNELIRHSLQRSEICIQWKRFGRMPNAILNAVKESGNQVKILRLKGNKLVCVPAWTNNDLPVIEELDFSNNSLSFIPDECCTLTTVKKLNLNFNAIYALPPAIGQLLGLQELRLTGNKLATFPHEISKVSCDTLSLVSHNFT